MASAGLENIDKSVQKTNEWLKDIMESMGIQDKHRAYLALRATLHALRDRLPVDEAAQLGAQFPLLIKGLYFDGWVPAKTPKKLSKDEFVDRVHSHFMNNPDIDAEELVRCVLSVIVNKTSEGEMEDIKNSLPKDFMDLMPL